jgi:hypothetical protein
MMGFANAYGYSDTDPYEIVRRVSDKCLEVRAMDAELSKDWKPEFVSGGFAGHCVNNERQQWIITPNVNGRVLRIRLRKDGTWRSKYGERFALSETPSKHRDYNF